MTDLNLENQVKTTCADEEKVKKLLERVADLERFYRMTVGRELRMVELKRQINELEEKNRQLKEKIEKGGEEK